MPYVVVFFLHLHLQFNVQYVLLLLLATTSPSTTYTTVDRPLLWLNSMMMMMNNYFNNINIEIHFFSLPRFLCSLPLECVCVQPTAHTQELIFSLSSKSLCICVCERGQLSFTVLSPTAVGRHRQQQPPQRMYQIFLSFIIYHHVLCTMYYVLCTTLCERDILFHTVNYYIIL
jgi:hypothetical protein